MDLPQPDATPASRGLPLGVFVLAGLRVLDGALMGAAVTGIRPLNGDELFVAALPGPDWLHVAYALAAVASVAAAIGLLAGHRWGWAGTMLLTGFGLLLAIWAFVGGANNDLRLFVLVGSAFYLNQRKVREHFWGPLT